MKNNDMAKNSHGKSVEGKYHSKMLENISTGNGQPMQTGKQELVKSISKYYRASKLLLDSKKLTHIKPDRITRIYHTPCPKFPTETDVIQYYGYKIGNKFAQGGFSTIFYATHLPSNIEVACKKVDLLKSSDKTTTDRSKVEDLKNELFILTRLNNPYIVKLYAHFVVDRNLYIFIKLANYGTLAKLVDKRGVLSERDSQLFFGQMLVAIEYLHSLDIAHRDIKLENILLLKHPNNKITILITDFGLSRLVTKQKGEVIKNRTYCGTMDYMAPEILTEKPYNALMVDIWALGIALFAMLNNKFPFEADNPAKQLQLQLARKWKFSDNVIDNPSKSLLHIIYIMLDPTVETRAHMSTLVSHPWIVAEYEYAKHYFK